MPNPEFRHLEGPLGFPCTTCGAPLSAHIDGLLDHKFKTTIPAMPPIQSTLIIEQTAPTRATSFPSDAAGRKAHPVASGVLDYFPDALVAIAHVSWKGNEQHNPGKPLHWARGKSKDEADALLRHFLERGSRDTDGLRHSAKMAWRALALLQKEIEAEGREQP